MKTKEDFLKSEMAGGIFLLVASIAAIVAENSEIKPYYDLLFSTKLQISLGSLCIAKPLLIWVNDALMAVFFFLIGLELKREILVGQLSHKNSMALPGIAATLGLVCPAIIYTYFNHNNPVAMQGWAIPVATDIAFALGVMSLLHDKVPKSLKLLLLSIAIIDDIGAIVIIGIYYSAELSMAMLGFAAVCLIILWGINIAKVKNATPYMLVGLVLWVSVLKSGIHATFAGILLAMFIPLEGSKKGEKPLLIRLENYLHGRVTYFILPLFAFANAGVNLSVLHFNSLLNPIPLGVCLGLVFGNQIGIFFGTFFTVKLGLSKLPEKVSWLQIYGVSALCGIGFTMSLFIALLAFEQGDMFMANQVRLGIITGSLISAAIGYSTLHFASRR